MLGGQIVSDSRFDDIACGDFDRLFLVGDSHVGALVRAYRTGEVAIPDGLAVEFCNLGGAIDLIDDFFEVRPRGVRVMSREIRAKCSKSLRAKQDPDRSFLSETNFVREDAKTLFGFSVGFHTNDLLTGADDEPWSTYAPWSSSLAGERIPLSRGVLRAMARDATANSLAFLLALKERGLRLVVISAPPPTTRYPILKLGYQLDDLLAMDAEIRTEFAESLHANGIDYILPFEGASEGGLLREEYLTADERDVHHGNIEYGKKMLEHVLRQLGRA